MIESLRRVGALATIVVVTGCRGPKVPDRNEWRTASDASRAQFLVVEHETPPPGFVPVPVGSPEGLPRPNGGGTGVVTLATAFPTWKIGTDRATNQRIEHVDDTAPILSTQGNGSAPWRFLVPIVG